jgi:flavin-dependent dehydrogenase
VKRLAIDTQVCIDIQAVPRGVSGILVESTSDGWWFSAPTGDGRRGVSWFTDARSLRGALRSEAALMSHLKLAQHTSAAIESLAYAERKVRVAGTSLLSRFAGEGWLAIGDAAIARDPLSSQGVLAALESSSAALAAIQAQLLGLASGMHEYADFQRNAARRFIRERQVLYDREKREQRGSFWRERSMSLPVFAV